MHEKRKEPEGIALDWRLTNGSAGQRWRVRPVAMSGWKAPIAQLPMGQAGRG